MNNEFLSLCIPYYDFFNNKVSNLMWRIADFSREKNELYSAKYTVEGDNEYLPRKLSVNPYNTMPFKPSIYAWLRNEDLRVRSNDTEITPIEIIKLENSMLEKYKSDLKIREILHKGIPLHEHTLEQFLLVINENDTYCEALYLRKKMSCSTDKKIFQIEQNCQDMLKTVHKVELITFEKTDIIDTKESNIYSEEHSLAPTRFFYKYIDLPRMTRNFELREPQNYARAFVSKYYKIKQNVVSLSNKDRQRLGQFIDMALTDKAEIDAFFEITGYSLNDVEYALKDLNSDILKMQTDNSMFYSIVEDAILRNDNLRPKLIEIAKNLWIKESTEEKTSLEKIINDAVCKLNKTEEEYKVLLSDIEKANLEIEKLNSEEVARQQELENSNIEIKKIKANIQAEIQNFKDDVVHLAALSAFSKPQTSISNKNKGFIAQEGSELDELELDPAENINIFIDDLQLNLDIAGMTSSSIAVSQIITSTLIANKNLILDANSDNIADGLSSLLDSCYANKVFITDSIVDIEALVEYINSLSAKVVLIYGLLDTFNERLFVTLSHLCKNKFMILACEDIDTFDTLPSHWWKYATILSVRNYIGVHTAEEYESYIMDKKIFVYENDTNCDVKDIKRVIAKNLRENIMTNTQALSLQEIFTICKQKFDNFKLAQEYLLKLDSQSIENNEV